MERNEGAVRRRAEGRSNATTRRHPGSASEAQQVPAFPLTGGCRVSDRGLRQNSAVLAEGFKGVLRTGRSVAAGRGSERGNAQLVELYQQYKRSDEYFLEHSHHLTFLRIFATVS